METDFYNVVCDALDERWITLQNGSHVLLGEGGEIKAGMGGKFNGGNIKTVGSISHASNKAPAHVQKAISTLVGSNTPVEYLIKGYSERAQKNLEKARKAGPGKTGENLLKKAKQDLEVAEFLRGERTEFGADSLDSEGAHQHGDG
jgi:hypothetical protein